MPVEHVNDFIDNLDSITLYVNSVTMLDTINIVSQHLKVLITNKYENIAKTRKHKIHAVLQNPCSRLKVSQMFPNN
ncbi:CLUMA_CG015525, isoform A [Clunio marinus]|uniref:CLUMA_CG015525, isoform A n=1 Tax=Clunio marinus TaxID=568069 RepID=A0A1J1IPM1_9DIPT|nr:CLUMA_CG015525, isoform A [Clunio marinus]